MEHKERQKHWNRGPYCGRSKGQIEGLANVGPLVGESRHSGKLCSGTCVGPGDTKKGHRIPPGRMQFSGEDTILVAISDTYCSGGVQQVARKCSGIPQLWFKAQLCYLRAVRLCAGLNWELSESRSSVLHSLDAECPSPTQALLS